MSAPGLPPRKSPPLDAPDAAALVEAVAAWLHDELLPRTEGADRWALRIAANALTVAGRELSTGPAVVEAHRGRLHRLGYESERELCEAIRSGAEDGRLGELAVAIGDGIEASLAIANPGYSTSLG